jgi:hypothetical protein
MCDNCYAETDASRTEAEAITAWNTRTPDPALKAKAEALEAALEAIIKDRDERCSDLEQYVTGGNYGDHWTPSASMVSSKVIANGRAALASYQESEQ